MIRDVSVFYRQLGAALKAGLPLLQALSLAAAACRGAALRAAAADVERRVRAGDRLAQAMAAHPEAFREVDVALVAVGEEHGRLEENLELLAGRREEQHHAARRFALALAYPAFLLVAALFLPQLFVLVTKGPLAYAAAVGRTALPLALVLGAACGAALLFRRGAPQSFDRLLLQVPVLGRNLGKLALARFGESLAALYEGGVEMRRSLRLATRALGNRHLESRCRAIPEIVAKGGSLAEAIGAAGVFPPEMVGTVDVGERTGDLDTALRAFARLSREEADRAIRALMIAVPVVIYLLVAAYIAWVVISFFGAYFRGLSAI